MIIFLFFGSFIEMKLPVTFRKIRERKNLYFFIANLRPYYFLVLS